MSFLHVFQQRQSTERIGIASERHFRHPIILLCELLLEHHRLHCVEHQHRSGEQSDSSGHRRDAPRASDAAVKICIPHELIYASFLQPAPTLSPLVLHTRGSDIDNAATRLQPFSADQSRTPHCRDEDVRLGGNLLRMNSGLVDEAALAARFMEKSGTRNSHQLASSHNTRGFVHGADAIAPQKVKHRHRSTWNMNRR